MTRPCVQVRLTRPWARPDDRFGVRGRAAIRGAAVAAATTLALLLAPAAFARDFLVNTTQDGPTGQSCDDGTCTLREAVLFAQPTDTITVPAGEYFLTIGELVLLGDTINGAGARSTIIDGNQSSRVLRITGPAGAGPLTSTVTGVTIRRGNSASPNLAGSGGGVLLESASLSSTTATLSPTPRPVPAAASPSRGTTASARSGRPLRATRSPVRSVDGGGHRSDRRKRRTRPGQPRPSPANSALVADGWLLEGRRDLHQPHAPDFAFPHVTIAGNPGVGRRWPRHDGPDDPVFASQMSNKPDRRQHPHRLQPRPLTGVADASQPHPGQHLRARRRPTTSRASTPRCSDLTNNGGLTDTRALPGRQSSDQRGRLPARKRTRGGSPGRRRPAISAPSSTSRPRSRDHQRGQRQRRHGRLAHLSRHAQRRRRRRQSRVRPGSRLSLPRSTSPRAHRLHGHVGGDCSPRRRDARREPEPDLHHHRERQRASGQNQLRRPSSARA